MFTRTRSRDQTEPRKRIEDRDGGIVGSNETASAKNLIEGWSMWTSKLNRVLFFVVVLLVSEVSAQTTQGGIVGEFETKKALKSLVRK